MGWPTLLGILRSGLSEPYSDMASWYDIRGKGSSFPSESSGRDGYLFKPSALVPSSVVFVAIPNCPLTSHMRQLMLIDLYICRTRFSTSSITSFPFAKDISKSSCSRSFSGQKSTEDRMLREGADLCELGLSVGAQILIPETSCKLEIFPNARGHEDLLVLLRTLR